MEQPVTGAQILKICVECGAEYLGGQNARLCFACRKRHSSESCHRRRLWDIGARARWGRKPEWVGPSAELLPEETEKEVSHAKRKT